MTERVRAPLHPAPQAHPRVCTQTYPGRADQVPKVRAFVAQTAAGGACGSSRHSPARGA